MTPRTASSPPRRRARQRAGADLSVTRQLCHLGRRRGGIGQDEDLTDSLGGVV